jgi:hypothetical protein
LTDKCWKRDQFNTLPIDRKGSNAPQLFFCYYAFYFFNTCVTIPFCAAFFPLLPFNKIMQFTARLQIIVTKRWMLAMASYADSFPLSVVGWSAK